MIEKQFFMRSGQRTVLPETLEATPGIDYQGISYTRQPRPAILQLFRASFPPFFCVLNRPPVYPTKTIRSPKPLFGFEFFNHSYWVAINHQQLTNLIVAASQDHIICASENHILEVDTKTNEHHRLASYRSFCIDFDQNSDLICGSHNQSHIFLYNLRRKRQEMLLLMGCELINSVRFHKGVSPALVISANLKEIQFFDLERQKVSHAIPAVGFVNFSCWHPGSNLHCLVMDDVDVQISDERAGYTDRLMLQGHQDYNFACCFLNENLVATGGQDCSVRIWDLRKSTTQLQLLEGNGREVCTLKYNSKNSTLYSIEKVEALNAFRIQGGQWTCSTFDFIGFPKGFDFTPSKDRMFLAIAERSLGGIMGLTLA